MNGLATRNRIRQATHMPAVRELDARREENRRADRIVGTVGVAGMIIIALWLFIEQLAQFIGGFIA